VFIAWFRFRESFLGMGGAYHPNKVFRKFRGRDPCADAILWSLGLKPMTVVEEKSDAEKPDRKDIAESNRVVN